MLQAVLPFLAKIGAVALKVGAGAAKAGSVAAKGAGGATKFMSAAAPFMSALGMGGGGSEEPQAQQMPMGASAPMTIAGLNSAAPNRPSFVQQMPGGMDPMMMEMLRRQRGMM